MNGDHSNSPASPTTDLVASLRAHHNFICGQTRMGKPTDFSRAADALERTQWRPIESAPMGGAWILVWWPTITDCPVVAYRSPEGWRCPIGSYLGYSEHDEDIDRPTHWMPLPEPPK